MSSPDNGYRNESRENTEFLQSQEIEDLCNASTIVNISIQKKDIKKAKIKHEEVQDEEIKYEEVTHDLKGNQGQKVVSFSFLNISEPSLQYYL